VQAAAAYRGAPLRCARLRPERAAPRPLPHTPPPQERAAGYKKKDFKAAKFDFTDKMLEWSGVGDAPAKVLDVGCGIGGTTRHLAKKFGAATQLTGITLSPNQARPRRSPRACLRARLRVPRARAAPPEPPPAAARRRSQVRRATELAAAAGLQNCEFRVMDALKMEFPDNSFDFVWACESGEHMPDKRAYVEEMVRVLKPGGKIVIATWCQREATPETPITAAEQKELRFLYEEWSHPYFISIEEYVRMLKGTGACATVSSDDWAPYTIPAWRHSVWAGVWDPWPVVVRPHLWYKTVRDIVCLEKMHQARLRALRGVCTQAALRVRVCCGRGRI
jgi:MPBQ/MSBQ methyltransferase